MKHECALCIRDNKQCTIGKSFFDILLGKTKDCNIYADYTQKIEKKKTKELIVKMKNRIE